MNDYRVTRAAVEMERIESTPEILELGAIDRQQKRFSWLSLATIIVSFVHMASALVLFSGHVWYEVAAALAMTGLVDFATWAIANYKDYAKRRKLSRSGWVNALFGFALAISVGLNFSYLYANQPPATQVPPFVSFCIAVTFACFIPGCIAVASLIRGELEDDKLRQEQAMPSKKTPDVTIETIPVSALPGPNETKRQSRQQAYNTKTRLATSDAESILITLRQAGVSQFRYAKDLGEICGWESPSSCTKALDALRSAGMVREIDGGYEVL